VFFFDSSSILLRFFFDSSSILLWCSGLILGGVSPLARLELSSLEKDLNESLARLQTSYLDVYLLHRDDPVRFPNVSTIVENMHGLVLSGKIKAWGTSNFTVARLVEIHACAVQHNWTPPSHCSPQCSLAVPTRAVWEGTTHWSEEHRSLANTKVCAWATLGEGTLCGTVPDRRGGAACWSSALNQQRRARLQAMAQRKGVSAAVVAIAYVLNHVPGCSAIVGCRNGRHFQDAARASTMVLREEEMKWLRCED
jgi:aryl-alcohol dehydrogenase-like predicted oxidoreductase